MNKLTESCWKFQKRIHTSPAKYLHITSGSHTSPISSNGV